MKTAINLLPASFQRHLVIRRRALLWGMILGAGLLLGGVIRWSDVRANVTLTQRLELLTRENQPTQMMLKQLVDMRQELEELQQLELIAKELENQRPALTLLGILSEIGEGTAGKLRITKMELTGLQQGPPAKGGGADARGAGLMLTGVSLDNQSVAKLASGLKESGFFSQVDIVNSKETGDEGSSLREYQVRCGL